jgi:putative FmdB family regulatory protein
MPTYEYRCENGHTFEEFQSMVAAPIEICPICGGRAERIISGGSGLIFKGSGFYITDYAKKQGDAKESGAKSKEIKNDKPAPAKTEPTAPSSETKSTPKES